MGLYQKGQKALELKRIRVNLTKDCYVFVRELSSQELMNYQEKVGVTTTNLDFLYEVAAKCICDENGNAIFDNADDMKANLEMGTSTFLELWKAIENLSGLTPKK